MRHIFILLFLLLSFASCNDSDKFEFIRRFVIHPEKLIELLENSSFDATNYLHILKTDSSLIKLHEKWGLKFYLSNNKVRKEIWAKVIYYQTKAGEIKIILKSVDGFKLGFIWIEDENKTWELKYIREEVEPDKEKNPRIIHIIEK